jgi:hypothetical protein
VSTTFAVAFGYAHIADQHPDFLIGFSCAFTRMGHTRSVRKKNPRSPCSPERSFANRLETTVAALFREAERVMPSHAKRTTANIIPALSYHDAPATSEGLDKTCGRRFRYVQIEGFGRF